MDRSSMSSDNRLQPSRDKSNQRAMDNLAVFSASKRLAHTFTEDNGREILLQLLKQITEFLERKEMMSSRLVLSNEWRKSRSRRRSESNNLFQVVIQVCEQRMRRLHRSTPGEYERQEMEDWNAECPRLLVAEAIVQELLVSLMELRVKEKENLVMDEEEKVEIMRRLLGHLQKDEELVRNKVCVGAGDAQQLEELQLMLRTDFLEEVADVESPQKKQQANSAASNEASLQFAWETIEDQKKEILRLRGENEELKRLDTRATSALQASFFDDKPAKVINLLRTQLPSHHVKNVDILHKHICRLEKALQSSAVSSRKTRREWDGSKSTFDSSQSSGKGKLSSSLLSRSVIGTDFSRTRTSRKKCDECYKTSVSLLSLQSEVEQLRANAASDEETLLQAEKDREHFQRENSTLSTALLSAKQKQQELRQVVLDLTEEKHQLQNLSDSEQRTSERNIRVLQEQLDTVEEQKSHLKRKFDSLVSSYDAEVASKRALAKECAELKDTNAILTQSTTECQTQVTKLEESARRCETLVQTRDATLKDLNAQLDALKRESISQTTDLEQKKSEIGELTTRFSELQEDFDKLELEKRQTMCENERLLQALSESKRKNQRLENGFEELKQGKELVASLQEVERGTLALQSDELRQAREEIESLKMQLLSTKAECTRLENELSETTKSYKSEQSQHIDASERVQHELKTMKQTCLALEEQVTSQQELQSELETLKQVKSEQVEALEQELTESKTTMRMWMNKYKTVSEENRKLENGIQSRLEDQFSLQQMVLELEAEREAIAQKESASEMALKREMSSLTEQHRVMERECRIMDHDNKALVQLVQTLQARPELQQRAFREMLMTCQRGAERMLSQLGQKVFVTLEKLDALEKQYQTVKVQMTISKHRAMHAGGIARDEDASYGKSDHFVALKQTSPQIVVQEAGFLSSSCSTFSASQPVWLEAMSPLKIEDISRIKRRDDDAVESTILKQDLKQWKWKCLVQGLSSKQENIALTVQVNELLRSSNQLKKSRHLFTWFKLKAIVENRELCKFYSLGLAVIRRLSTKLLQNQQAQYFANWKYQAQMCKYQAKLRANDSLQSSFPPSTTAALATCIQLVRKCCESTGKVNKGITDRVATSHEELASHLMDINANVASWKIAVDHRLAEYTERMNQLKSVQRRCAELKDLAGLNQRLIEEMERRSTGQHNVMEAAWKFATAYKALSPSARAQIFQSRDFLVASKRIVEGLNSLGLPQSGNTLSQTLNANCDRLTYKGDDKSWKWNLSASAAPDATSGSISMARTIETSRKRLNDSNIELLEDAVGSLKGAMQKQRNLQLELRNKERSLIVTTNELHRRNVHFLLLQSFLQWKCSTLIRIRRHEPSRKRGSACS